MRIAITDANIFIDIIYVNLHDKLFTADIEIHTTLLVLDELNNVQRTTLQKYIDNGDLFVHIEEPPGVPISIQSNKRLSFSDKSIFDIALRLEAIILTGDNLIRSIASTNDMEVHGMLWLFDRFVELKTLSKKDARQHLQKLMAFNRRLPQDECEIRIQQWSEKP